MKAFHHDVPPGKDEWVFAFVGQYRELPAEIGDRYTQTHAILACNGLGELTPKKAGQKWGNDPR